MELKNDGTPISVNMLQHAVLATRSRTLKCRIGVIITRLGEQEFNCTQMVEAVLALHGDEYERSKELSQWVYRELRCYLNEGQLECVHNAGGAHSDRFKHKYRLVQAFAAMLDEGSSTSISP